MRRIFDKKSTQSFSTLLTVKDNHSIQYPSIKI